MTSKSSVANPQRLEMTAAEDAGMDSARIARISPLLQQLVDDKRLAGMVTIGARRNRIVHFDAMGYHSIESGEPMAKDAIFRIYSMTKPITGVAMMILYEQGKFSLSDPVERYIPEFADMEVFVAENEDGTLVTEPAAQPLTIRHLMSHTGGIAYGHMMGEHPIDLRYSAEGVFDPDSDLTDLVRKIASIPLKFQPGQTFNYSASCEVQGYLVEKLSGQRFGDFLQEQIFAPLGMVDSGFFVPEDKLHRLAEVYHYDDNDALVAQELYDGAIRHKEEQRLQAGGWGLCSTAMDYLRFCQMLLNGGELDGTRILGPATVKLMHTNHLPAGVTELDLLLGGQPGCSFGLDFAIVEDPVENGTAYSKGEYFWGGAAGTWFWIDPVEDLVFVGMVQQFMGQLQIPDVRGISKRAFYSAIIDME